jgi:hypothetical protein
MVQQDHNDSGNQQHRTDTIQLRQRPRL